MRLKLERMTGVHNESVARCGDFAVCVYTGITGHYISIHRPDRQDNMGSSLVHRKILFEDSAGKPLEDICHEFLVDFLNKRIYSAQQALAILNTEG